VRTSQSGRAKGTSNVRGIELLDLFIGWATAGGSSELSPRASEPGRKSLTSTLGPRGGYIRVMTPQPGSSGTGPLYAHTADGEQAAKEDVIIPNRDGDVVASLDETPQPERPSTPAPTTSVLATEGGQP
jgi:hypothetical protein